MPNPIDQLISLFHQPICFGTEIAWSTIDAQIIDDVIISWTKSSSLKA